MKPLLDAFRFFPPFKKVDFLVGVGLTQDLELLLPILKSLKNDGYSVHLFVANDLLLKKPHVEERIRQSGIPWTVEISPELRNKLNIENFGLDLMRKPKVFLTGVESSTLPNQFNYKLTQYMNRVGVQTITFQHGLENIGLTYSDKEHSIEKVEFASHTILGWGNKEYFHTGIKEHTKNKWHQIGYMKYSSDQLTSLRNQKSESIISIFENLHWQRYTDKDRTRFVKICQHVAEEKKDIAFHIKTHPAGQWLKWNKEKVSFPKNVTIYYELNEKSCSELISQSLMVFTTPSTVILESIAFQKPVVVFSNESLPFDMIDLPSASNSPQLLQEIENVMNGIEAIPFLEINQAFQVENGFENCRSFLKSQIT